jgi:hypothetical protein
VHLPEKAIASRTPLGIVGLVPDLLYASFPPISDIAFPRPESYRRAARDVNSSLIKNPLLYRSARPEHGRYERERFLRRRLLRLG